MAGGSGGGVPDKDRFQLGTACPGRVLCLLVCCPRMPKHSKIPRRSHPHFLNIDRWATPTSPKTKGVDVAGAV